MNTQTYFRLCLFVPLIVPLPFLVFKGDEGLSSMFMAQLVFGMPPYVLVFVLPLVFLFGRMSERQIVMGFIFFPIIYPFVFGLFWSVVPNFITTMTITLTNTSQWVFTSIMFPAAYSMLFLSGNIIRNMLLGETGLLEQRVAAVLSADIRTNNQSMDKDNGDKAKRLIDYQESLEQIINEHRGQRTNRTGDNIVVEFNSVINAVKCGLSLQEKFNDIYKEQPTQNAIYLGMGINLGEVKSKGNSIRGSGVTVATGLEELAQASDIYISGAVYDRIKRKLIFNYEYKGEQTFQKIDSPVRVYLLKPDAAVPKTETATEVKLTIPEKLSIAVLPFDNMSADPEQEYFSDGISEDILTDLSKLSGLLVISRHSTFVYKGKSVCTQQISQDLGVRYVLEGSVRKAGNKIRITAQLIDAITNDHIWADRYDRDLDDIFALQDEVTRKIVNALRLNLTDLEEQRLGHIGTNNIEACDLLLHAREQFNLFTTEGVNNAIELSSQVIKLDPNYAEAYTTKSRVILFPLITGMSKSVDETLVPAMALARKAVELDDLLPRAHASLAWSLMWHREIDEAITEIERAVELDPNDADTLMWQSMILSSAGRGKEALEAIENAMRINPHYQVAYIFSKANAYFSLDQYEEAIFHYDKGIESNPNFIPNYLIKLAALSSLDKNAELIATRNAILKINPDLKLSPAHIFFNDKRLYKLQIDAYAKAGMMIDNGTKNEQGGLA
jgi:adenylate cyclase